MASECLKFDERPVTPKGVKKYRKSYFEEPGKRVTHFGAIDDHEDLHEKLSGVRFGVKSSGDDVHMKDMFTQGKKSEIAEYINEKKEAVYKSVKREPLGRSYVRGHNSPDVGDFGEAKEELGVGQAAKALIYSRSKADDEEEAKYTHLYKKSHNSYQPGEQRRRDYDWKGINPDAYRFGEIDKKALASEGVSFCLNPDVSERKTRLVNVQVDNFKAANRDKLGKSRRRGHAGQAASSLSAPGAMKAKKEREWSAAECIQGSYSIEEQLPDKDLGRAVRPGWRNSDSGSRVFGCPTVRTDIEPPKRRPLGDHNNYGDDPVAASLLYPSRFVEIGVQDEDFFEQRSKDEIRDYSPTLATTSRTTILIGRMEVHIKGLRTRVHRAFRASLNRMLDERETKYAD